MTELFYEAVKIILDKLISGAIDIVQIGQEVKSHDDLEKMMTTIELSLIDAHTMQFNPPQIQMLKQLGCVVQKMLDFHDERETRNKRRKVMSTSSSLVQKVLYLASSNPFVHAYRDARQVTSICKDLVPLDKDEIRNLFNMMSKPQRHINSEFLIQPGSYVASDEMVGRDGDRDKILSLLASTTDPFSVLAITGIGGIGKTVLAQYLYSTECVKTNFEVFLWVDVGQVFVSKEVIRKMLEIKNW